VSTDVVQVTTFKDAVVVVGAQGANGANGSQGATGAQGAQGVIGNTGAQGAQGATGPQGAQGATGNTGAQGAQGVIGAQGVASNSVTMNTYTFSITSNTTLITGLDDTANSLVYTVGLESVFINGFRQISGVDYNTTNTTAITLTANVVSTDVVQVTTFKDAVVVVGAQGAQGATGNTGAQGAQGATGAQGAQGVIGAQGAQGATGNTGAQGAQGAQGVIGAQGAIGNTVTMNTYTFSITSNTTLITGADDTANTLIYTVGLENVFINGSRQIAGVNYNTTNTTVITLAANAFAGDVVQVTTFKDAVVVVGAQGAQGATGAQGAASSVAGPQGTTGAQGAQGVQGTTGAQGAQGVQGTTGAQGAQGAQGALGARTYTVTNSVSSAYLIDGSSNPTLNLLRGFTYAFNVNASGHPFWIQTVSGAYSSGNIYNSGVTNNGVQVGTLTFAIPYDAPSTLYYVCQNHSLMQGVINISDVGPQGPQGAAAVVGGSNTHIQFNDSASSNGSAGFTFNKTSNNVTIANNISATTGTFAGAVSGITTLAAGNTTITGFANVSTTLQVGTNTATFGTAVYIIANGNFGIANSTPGQKLTVSGIIESTTGGIKFPDGTTQTSAGINIGKSIAMAMIFGG